MHLLNNGKSNEINEMTKLRSIIKKITTIKGKCRIWLQKTRQDSKSIWTHLTFISIASFVTFCLPHCNYAKTPSRMQSTCKLSIHVGQNFLEGMIVFITTNNHIFSNSQKKRIWHLFTGSYHYHHFQTIKSKHQSFVLTFKGAIVCDSIV